MSASPSSDSVAESNEDVEVLPDEGIGLRRPPPLQLGQRLPGGRLRALGEPRLQVQHLLVEAGHADLVPRPSGEKRAIT